MDTALVELCTILVILNLPETNFKWQEALAQWGAKVNSRSDDMLRVKIPSVLTKNIYPLITAAFGLLLSFYTNIWVWFRFIFREIGSAGVCGAGALSNDIYTGTMIVKWASSDHGLVVLSYLANGAWIYQLQFGWEFNFFSIWHCITWGAL